ncbi:hypothetical protein [Gordoniibacillus kamchatkensis]|uniref:hypothetical protein n=1 Tax=Gordoniibacillus kamchatkensis TaxID=1590651 RepID=UPI0012E02DB9|nr:hypothetical protein [Paenibacillus sp. VKM B-2647]
MNSGWYKILQNGRLQPRKREINYFCIASSAFIFEKGNVAMKTPFTTGQKLENSGLLPLIIIFAVIMASPLFYFLINLMLGNEQLFTAH